VVANSRQRDLFLKFFGRTALDITTVSFWPAGLPQAPLPRPAPAVAPGCLD